MAEMEGDDSFAAARLAMCEDAGRLARVETAVSAETPHRLEAVRLLFERGEWWFTVDPDDDTVVIAADRAEVERGLDLSDLVLAEPSEHDPWSRALGRSVRWIWSLRDQRGCIDGIQFEFTGLGSDEHMVQLMAAASSWRIYELTPARL